jgi:hypothetical protein
MRLLILFALTVVVLIQSSSRPVYVAAGLGIDGIAVGYSTKKTVLAKYGEEDSLIEHDKNSLEMKYDDQGMSFWYRAEDPVQKIFAISLWPESRGFTGQGIVVGRSTLKDVFDAYGKAEFGTTSDEKTWFVEYPGISFHVEYKSSDKQHWTPEELLKRKVIEIEIVAFELERIGLPQRGKDAKEEVN